VIVVLMVHTLSRLATMSGMPDTAPVILSYAVYALLLIATVLFLPGGLMSIPAALRRSIVAAKAARARANPS
jgi:branched-chain amino acid transport system permease protein